MELQVLDRLPEWFFDVQVDQLWEKLQAPTLIRLEGVRKPKLFVSVLLHGNEHTGFLAVQNLFKKLINNSKPLPREVLLFLGNIEAAEQNMRFLPHQLDHNRIWMGKGETPESKLANQVKEYVLKDDVFACVDIHNNTGKNPHYGCISKLTEENFYLASCFSRTVVYFIRPEEALSRVMSEHCPSITLECGISAEGRGTYHASEFLDALIHLDHFPTKALPKGELDLYETQVRVQLKEQTAFEFLENADFLKLSPSRSNIEKLYFPKSLDSLNFVEQNVGSVLGKTSTSNLRDIFELMDEMGNFLSVEDYFELQDGMIKTKQKVVPAMLTLDKKVIQQDCLGYLMQRVQHIR